MSLASYTRGWWGEAQTAFGLWLFLGQPYRRFSNVTLAAPNGTTQIDHVVISPFGIFVIETKNMNGWIYGSAHDAQWRTSPANDATIRVSLRYPGGIFGGQPTGELVWTLLRLAEELASDSAIFANHFDDLRVPRCCRNRGCNRSVRSGAIIATFGRQRGELQVCARTNLLEETTFCCCDSYKQNVSTPARYRAF